MRYASRRVYEWSPSIAYAVGLMTSDGCLQADGRHLDLTSVDIEQLENFGMALGRKFYIGTKRNGTGKISMRIQFGDVAFYDFLLRAGLMPKKSLSLERVYVPSKYYSDFLRGLFDGDGSCFEYYDPRWPTSYLFYTSFTSASKQFLEFISLQNSLFISLKGGSLVKSSKAYALKYGKRDSKLLYDFMYRDSSCINLTRKRVKLCSFIEKDTMLESNEPARVVKLVNTQP